LQNPWERGLPNPQVLEKCGHDAHVPSKIGGFAITSYVLSEVNWLEDPGGENRKYSLFFIAVKP